MSDGTKSRSSTDELLPAQRYILTEAERNALEEHVERKRTRRPCPKVRVTVKDTVANLVIEHADLDAGLALVVHALGSTDPDFAIGLITQLTKASARTGKTNEEGLNFMLAVIKSISPQDEIQSMLAAQMAAVHMMTMDFTMRLANANTIEQRDSAEGALIKLARTFTTQVEALKRHRTGGQKKVTVEHVHVHEGGQAIVGHVEHSAEGGRAKKE